MFGNSSATTIRSQRHNEFRSQMPMYAPTFNRSSARAEKTNIRSVTPDSVLEQVESLELSTWEFTEHGDVTHMGPMAEDFYEAFEVGDDDGTISTVDADGVALAAIQGLSAKLDVKAERIEELEHEADQKDDRIETVERETAALREENEQLREQYTELEARVAALEE